MYIFRFFVNAVSSAAESIFCACCWTSTADAAAEPLLTGHRRQSSYSTLVQNELGLTAKYTNWFNSKDALPYALGHLALFLFVAVVGFSFVFEDWSIINSLYFAIVVFTTVGYGDLSPTTNAARIFVVAFAFYGIVILGIFLGIVGEKILEHNDARMKERISNARVKVMESFIPEDNAEPPPQHSIRKDMMDICVAEAPIIVILVLLGLPIVYLEKWDIVQGLYWMVVTGTTIGFGDLGPTHPVTRAICIIWIPLAVAVLGEFLGRIAGVYMDRQNDKIEEEFLHRTMTLADIRRMDANNDNKVSPEEFLCYMLVALQKVEQKDIDDIQALFKQIDKTGDGFITKHDLMSKYRLTLRPGVVIDAAALEAVIEEEEGEGEDS